MYLLLWCSRGIFTLLPGEESNFIFLQCKVVSHLSANQNTRCVIKPLQSETRTGQKRVFFTGCGDGARFPVTCPRLTVLCCFRNSAAFSSALPPISPIRMMPSVFGSCRNTSRQSMKLVPLNGSPPIPETKQLRL